MGGQQAGCIGLLTLYAARCSPTGVVAYDESVEKLAKSLGLPVFPSVRNPEFCETLSKSDVLVSAHGREIVPKRLLGTPQLGGINVHPCLYRYKGADPVGRLLKEGNPKASVGVHCMTEKVDEGEVLVEEFVQVDGKDTVESIYNALYPYYAITLVKALGIMTERFQKG